NEVSTESGSDSIRSAGCLQIRALPRRVDSVPGLSKIGSPRKFDPHPRSAFPNAGTAMFESTTAARRQGLQSGTLTRNGELYFRSLLEKLPAGAYTCNPDGLITYFNQHAVQLWGRSPKLNDPVDRFCGSFKLYATDG